MSDLTDLQNAIRDFADRRNWQQFHTPKNLAMAICGEAGELAAEFQWLTPTQSSYLTSEQLEAVRLEIADVAIYLLRCADVLGIDVAAAVREKLAINESRFSEA
jgi:NTP pyrophosphatase (non-canonical NTP hydrolase)